MMMRSLLLAICLAASSSTAFSVDEVCLREFEAYRQSKIDLGVANKHLPRLDVPEGGRSPYTVIFIHGLFESPYFDRGLIGNFNAHGYNVLSILLPGHWERDSDIIDRISYRDWLNEVDKAVAIAGCLDGKLIFAGHSLGGTLALAGALKYRARTAGLVLWAPALQLKPLPLFGGVIGSITTLSGNTLTRRKPDHNEIPKYSANAPIQVYNLEEYLATTYGTWWQGATPPMNGNHHDLPLSYLGIYGKVIVPAFVVVPERDPAVSVKENLAMFEQLGGPKELIVYPQSSVVWHGNVTKSETDTYRTAPNDFNPDFHGMVTEMNNFLEDHLKSDGTS